MVEPGGGLADAGGETRECGGFLGFSSGIQRRLWLLCALVEHHLRDHLLHRVARGPVVGGIQGPQSRPSFLWDRGGFDGFVLWILEMETGLRGCVPYRALADPPRVPDVDSGGLVPSKLRYHPFP